MASDAHSGGSRDVNDDDLSAVEVIASLGRASYTSDDSLDARGEGAARRASGGKSSPVSSVSGSHGGARSSGSGSGHVAPASFVGNLRHLVTELVREGKATFTRGGFIIPQAVWASMNPQPYFRSVNCLRRLLYRYSWTKKGEEWTFRPAIEPDGTVYDVWAIVGSALLHPSGSPRLRVAVSSESPIPPSPLTPPHRGGSPRAAAAGGVSLAGGQTSSLASGGDSLATGSVKRLQPGDGSAADDTRKRPRVVLEPFTCDSGVDVLAQAASLLAAADASDLSRATLTRPDPASARFCIELGQRDYSGVPSQVTSGEGQAAAGQPSQPQLPLAAPVATGADGVGAAARGASSRATGRSLASVTSIGELLSGNGSAPSSTDGLRSPPSGSLVVSLPSGMVITGGANSGFVDVGHPIVRHMLTAESTIGFVLDVAARESTE